MSQTFGPFLAYPVRIHDFPGFYHSSLSGELEHQEEYIIENEAKDRQDEEGIPSDLRLTEEDFTDIIMDCANYSQMHEEMAEAYAEALDHVISERIGFWSGIHFHSMWSPREYNFSTDKLTVWVPEPTLRNLMVRSLANGHDVLSAVVREKFTTRSGFISNYSNDLAEWISKPIAEWDDIELGILIHAVMKIGQHDESLNSEVIGILCEDGETSYNIVSNNIDWAKVDEKVAEKRTELEEEHRATIDPDYVPPPVRCGSTIDMFYERYVA